MHYKKYIELGFKRIELNDSVEFDRNGHYGYALSKQITDNISIEVTNHELDKPKLYIKKADTETYHIIPIPFETIIDFIVITKEQKQPKKITLKAGDVLVAKYDLRMEGGGEIALIRGKEYQIHGIHGDYLYVQSEYCGNHAFNIEGDYCWNFWFNLKQ